MYLDSLDQIMSAHAETTVATHTISTYIDRLAKMEDGAGDPLYVYGRVAATCTTGGGSATVQILVVGNATDPTFASGNVTLADSGVIPYATLVAGYQYLKSVIPRQPSGSLEPTTSFYRYIGCQIIIATAALTAGSFDLWVTGTELRDNLSYRRGYEVKG